MFPDLLICNKQMHSKYKFRRQYSTLSETFVQTLHHSRGLSIHDLQTITPEWNDINITEFLIQTKPDIQVVVCSIGKLSCISKWRSIL